MVGWNATMQLGLLDLLRMWEYCGLECKGDECGPLCWV